MSDGPYAGTTAAGSSWPQGKPTDPDEWSEDELNAWIDQQYMTDEGFRWRWDHAHLFTHPLIVRPDGAAW